MNLHPLKNQKKQMLKIMKELHSILINQKSKRENLRVHLQIKTMNPMQMKHQRQLWMKQLKKSLKKKSRNLKKMSKRMKNQNLIQKPIKMVIFPYLMQIIVNMKVKAIKERKMKNQVMQKKMTQKKKMVYENPSLVQELLNHQRLKMKMMHKMMMSKIKQMLKNLQMPLQLVVPRMNLIFLKLIPLLFHLMHLGLISKVFIQ